MNEEEEEDGGRIYMDKINSEVIRGKGEKIKGESNGKEKGTKTDVY